ncbi:MAG: DUF305 domain-containing protein [Gemmatimonadales bacterium]
MIYRTIRAAAAVLLLLSMTSACAAPSTMSRSPDPRPAPILPRPPVTAADITFMQDMVAHHSQALVMAVLVPARSTRRDLNTLAERIIASQKGEIGIMNQWLRDHDVVPDSGAHMHPGMAMPLMPGMLSAAQLDQLRAATGSEFERLFLQFMVQHHSGAIVMVDKLFATYGAGQDDFIFKFASDVAADQESEIARMESMLGAMSTPATRP